MAARKRRQYAAYDIAFKLKVIKHSEESGSNRATADHFGVNERQVRYWKNQKSELLVNKKSAQRLPGGGRPVKDKEMDESLIQWVRDNRREGIPINGTMVRMQAKRKAEDAGFVASDGWLRSFKRRHCLSTRAGTSIGQKLPRDHEDKLDSFQKFILQLRKQHDYPLSHIYNMDETPMRFDMPPTHTLHPTGDKTVHIKTTNSEKRGFTAILTISADGTKLKPWAIFKGVRDPKIATSQVKVTMQRKGYIDEGSKYLNIFCTVEISPYM